MEVLQSIILVIIGIVSSYLGSIVSGSNAILSVGSMILIGIPPQLAKSTFQFGLIGWSISGIWNFFRSGHIPQKVLLGSVLASFFGGYIGASIMTLTPNYILQKIAGIIFLLYVPLSVWRNIKMRGFKAEEDNMDSLIHRNLAYLGQFVFSIMSGYIPGAAGGMYYIWYSEILKIKILEYKALGRMTGLAFSLGTFYPVIHAGLLDAYLILPFLFGTFLGGFLGAKHLIHMGNAITERIVLASVVLLGLYLLFS